MTARVLVVDDHVLVRQGIVRLLQDETDIEVVGEASNGFEAVNKARDLEVDIVLMDLYMAGLDGVATTRLIKRDLPNVEVIIVTASDEEDDLLEAIQAGARGYVIKSVDISDLIQQIRQVLTGGVGMTNDLTTKLVTGLARRGSKSLNADLTKRDSLTEREKEVLGLIAQGATNKEIAASLFISENTVRAHVRTLMQKLHMDNRTQLAVYGVHEGYTVNGRAGNPRLGVSRKQAAAARPR